MRQRHYKFVAFKVALESLPRRSLACDYFTANHDCIFDSLACADVNTIAYDAAKNSRAIAYHYTVPKNGITNVRAVLDSRLTANIYVSTLPF